MQYDDRVSNVVRDFQLFGVHDSSDVVRDAAIKLSTKAISQSCSVCEGRDIRGKRSKHRFRSAIASSRSSSKRAGI